MKLYDGENEAVLGLVSVQGRPFTRTVECSLTFAFRRYKFSIPTRLREFLPLRLLH